MQGDVARIVAAEGLAIHPGQYPLLAVLELRGPQSVGEIVSVTGVSQPAVTRSLGRLAELGLVSTDRTGHDLRNKIVSLTEAGRIAMARSKAAVWPRVEAAVIDLCSRLSGSLLEQLGAIEDALVERPLHARGAEADGLAIIPFRDELASAFHDINAQWISSMFALEATDREVLEQPQARIIEPGGDILFVTAAGLGVVGTCALQKTGEKQFELTKMGVLERARGRKAGEFLLRAVLRRATELGAERLYLLTNSACKPAIHLYEKLGFVHDAGIMREFGTRYKRSDVAMLYRPGPTDGE